MVVEILGVHWTPTSAFISRESWPRAGTLNVAVAPLNVGVDPIAVSNLSLSAGAYDRILKVSRTIADLAGAPRIQAEHVPRLLGTGHLIGVFGKYGAALEKSLPLETRWASPLQSDSGCRKNLRICAIDTPSGTAMVSEMDPLP